MYNRNAAETLSVRIGIHATEPVADRNDLFGAKVQFASRLCCEVEANGIVVSARFGSFLALNFVGGCPPSTIPAVPPPY